MMQLKALFIFLSILLGGAALAIERPEQELKEIGVTQNLGTTIDTNLVFTDQAGRTAPLKDFIAPNRPTILVPVYYECPRLCGMVLSGLSKVINETQLKFGQDYQVIAVSFDPTEGPKLAVKRRDGFLKQLFYSSSDQELLTDKHVHFLVGEKEPVATLMKQIGFTAKKDHDEFAHAASIMILTPMGQISQYLMGVSFSQFDLRLALVEASQGAIGSLVDHVMLFCFRFDQLQGKYIWVAFDAFWWGGVLTLVLLGLLMVRMLRLEKRRGVVP